MSDGRRADRARSHDRTEQLLATDRAYWRNHQVDVLPPTYRRELHALADAEVITATELDPNGALREAAETIKVADRIDLAAVVYNQRIGESFLEATADKRLVLNTTLIEEVFLEQDEGGLNSPTRRRSSRFHPKMTCSIRRPYSGARAKRHGSGLNGSSTTSGPTGWL